jgi:demethylmenaquinone methyltransferase/2-methoxy-6-polyprenyl-1,4-benzoquinol methylase
MTVKPYNNDTDSKKGQVERMFDTIAPKYDLLNRLLSARIDTLWRKKLIHKLKPYKPEVILDVATGTADVAIEALKLKPKQVIGMDLSAGMLSLGQQKIEKLGVDHIIKLEQGDSENLSYTTGQFDAVTVAFGVRNFENLTAGLTEINRVLKPGGVLAVLEFSQPQGVPFKQLYSFYSRFILPGIGKLVSKDASAYTYLPESVEAFPYGAAFAKELEKAGFAQVGFKPLTFGISTIYHCVKKEN